MEKSVKTFYCMDKSPEEYKCTVCPFTTNIKAIMSLHIKVLHRKRPNNIILGIPLKSHGCRICDFRTYSLFCLTKHVHSFNHMTKFPRATCPYKSNSKKNLKLHLSKEHKTTAFKLESSSLKAKPKSKPKGTFKWGQRLFHCMWKLLSSYKCEYCGLETHLKTMMSFHINMIHKKRSVTFVSECPFKYKCESCKFQTYSLLMLTKHIYSNNHVVNGAFKSKDKSLKSRCNFEKQSSLPVPNKPESSIEYECYFCPFKSNDRLDVTYHKCAKYRNKKMRKYKCDLCTYEAFQKPHLEDHIRTKHTDAENITWFECSHCPLKSKKKIHLKNHILTIHENVEESSYHCKYTDAESIDWFECVRCLYKTKEKSCLKNHMLASHINEEASSWFYCDKCAVKFKVKALLKLHVLRDHDNAIKCDFCPYETKHRQNLDYHVTVKHRNCSTSESVWFRCEQCPYKAAEKCTLKNHVIAKHTNLNINWFTCEQCPYESHRKGNLKAHIFARHTKKEEIEWFMCEHCAYKAKVKSCLKRHVIRKHKDFSKT